MDEKKILDEKMLEEVTGGIDAEEMKALNHFALNNCVFCYCDECPGGHPYIVFQELGPDGICPHKEVSL